MTGGGGGRENVADAFPEVAENLAQIELVHGTRSELTRRLRTSDMSMSMSYNEHMHGAGGVIDDRVGTAALSRDNIYARMEQFGGRDHGSSVAGLMALHREQAMPLPPRYMPEHSTHMERQLTEMERAKFAASRSRGGGSLAESPFLDPIVGQRKLQSRAASQEFQKHRAATSGRLATAESRGRSSRAATGRQRSQTAPADGKVQSKRRAPKPEPRFVSPLPWGDRLYLASAPWRLPEAKLDAHDKAVISSMPYTAHKVVPNDTGISTLGKVLRQHQSEPKVMAAAIAALGDKANYGKNAVLAHIVPQLKNRNPELRAAALKAISHVSVSGQERQYCELEFTVHSASNLPKKDRFGACDAYVKLSLVTPHGIGAEGVEDGGDVGEQGGRGWVRERSQTRIVWRDLNPVWKQGFNWEILNPDEEVIEMSVWDEDGETDDLVGTASLSLYEVPFDNDGDGNFPTISRSLNIYSPKGEVVRGYNNVTTENDGEPSKLHVKARFSSFLRPSDLMDGLVSQLRDTNPLPRIAASKAMSALAPPGTKDALHAAVQMLWDRDPKVQAQALRDLRWCGREFPVDAAVMLGEMLDAGRTAHKRMMAVSGLAAVADGGSESTDGLGEQGEYVIVTRELAKRIEHPDAEVRAHVPEGFRVICGGKRGDPLAVDEVCRRLDHPSEGAREAAALSLSQVARAGDEVALDMVEPLLNDPSPSVRHAAVLATFFLGDVGAGVVPQLEKIRVRAQNMLMDRVEGNQGRGDIDLRVKISAGRLAPKLNKTAKSFHQYTAAPEGVYSSVIPASTVHAGTRGAFPYSKLVEEMPIDKKFHSTLPYTAPEPPWDPIAQEKRRLMAIRNHAEENIAVLSAQQREIGKAGPKNLSKAEIKEIEELEKQIAKLREADEKAAAEHLAIAGPAEVQPNNTTKLGFSVKFVIESGDHCSDLGCIRSKYY